MRKTIFILLVTVSILVFPHNIFASEEIPALLVYKNIPGISGYYIEPTITIPSGTQSLCYSLHQDIYTDLDVGYGASGMSNSWSYQGKDLGQWFGQGTDSSINTIGAIGLIGAESMSNRYFSDDYEQGVIRGNQPYPYTGYLNFFSNYDCSGTVNGHITFTVLGLDNVILGASNSSCSDGIKNQNETDIDIGGVCQELTHNPILIIPGVLGTEISKPTENGPEKLWLNISRTIGDIGDQFMDPLQFNTDLTPSDASLIIDDVIDKKVGSVVFDYTDGLIEEFEGQGYTKGTDVFLFPYDWRFGVNEDNVSKLKQKIEDIRVQTGSDKVDVISHSTGGLLAKKYVMDNQADNHIGKAIFVGVPNTGAPQAIKALLQGSNFGVPLLADEEMKKIAKNMPVIYDLLPSLEYYNKKGSYITVVNQYGSLSSSQDLDFYQSNSFLNDDHNLNTQALSNAQNLHTEDFDNFDMRNSGVDVYSINGCKAGTLTKIIENRSVDSSGNATISYLNPEMLPGDSTVPLESSTNLPINQSNKYYSSRSSHPKMLSQRGIRQQIVNLITGSNLSTKDISNLDLITQDISRCKLNGKSISIYSPLDIDITDDQGNHSGLVDGAVKNDIPNASFEIMGDHKFVYLPDDEGQIYTINVKGTDSGTFTLKNENITDNEVSQTEVFSNIPVTTSLAGQVNLGGITTLSLDNNGDSIIDQTIEPSSVTDANQSKDLISPVSTSMVTGIMAQSGFYRSDVNIDISAIDPVIMNQELETSGILKINYNLDDTGYQTYSTPVSITTEGEHTIKFFSTDNAGNNEVEQSITFSIDKNAPELKVSFDINNKDVVLSAWDTLDPNPSILTNSISTVIKDSSENTTIIPFIKYKDSLKKLRFTYNKIIRNGIVTLTPNTSIIYEWKDKKGILSDLDTKIIIKGIERYAFNYKKATNTTIIKIKTDSGVITTTQSGFVVVTVKTEADGLSINY